MGGLRVEVRRRHRDLRSLRWDAQDHREHRTARGHRKDSRAPSANGTGAVQVRATTEGAGAAGAIQADLISQRRAGAPAADEAGFGGPFCRPDLPGKGCQPQARARRKARYANRPGRGKWFEFPSHGAKVRPNIRVQQRTVSQRASIPRCASISSTSRKLRVNWNLSQPAG